METLRASWVLVRQVFVCGYSPHVQNCLYSHRSLFGFLDPARDSLNRLHVCRPCLRSVETLYSCACDNTRVSTIFVSLVVLASNRHWTGYHFTFDLTSTISGIYIIYFYMYTQQMNSQFLAACVKKLVTGSSAFCGNAIGFL